ncbi:MAG: hypothetical protein EXS35_14495 [Pedosphaera sp.]|nr:hypothetical protein [Pedosphaera sp.]
MKILSLWLTAGLLASGVAFAGELSEADQKWSSAVEKMIEKGAEKISTPDSNRADLAVQLAKKHNRTATIQKNDKGYEVVFTTATKSTTVAKNDK